jgi:hypothetical protein
MGLFVDMVIACFGSVLLILLALTGTVSRGIWWRACLVTIVAIELWIATIDRFLPLQNSYPEALTSRVALYAIDKFSRSNAAKYLFLIEGSSVTTRGLNGDLLEERLRAEGIPATVIQISLNGANHLERLEILKEFVGGLSLSDKARLAQSKVVFCREVEAGYDRSPFNHVESNQFTDRTLAYINVRNFPEICHWLFGRYGLEEVVQHRDLLGALVTHELFNLFRIGYFQRSKPPGPFGLIRGFSPTEEGRPDFHPDDPLPPTLDLSEFKKQEKAFQKFTRWNIGRDKDFRRVLPGSRETELFFSVPNWKPYDVAYDFWRSRHAGGALYFCGNSVSVRTVLANPDLWSDPTHLKSAGADLYTAEFSKFLTDQIRSGRL